MPVFNGVSILMLAISIALPASSGAGDGAAIVDKYAKILDGFVNESGQVDYAGLKDDPRLLHELTEMLARLQETQYNRWQDNDKIAFWINAYNGLTLKAIVDHYPIKPSKIRSLVFPKNSIMQIPGVWKKLKFDVMGKQRTLDEIEHKILRAGFKEPRIHVALVCASIGCPPLRTEPYVGKRLQEQLNDQTVRFLISPLNFRIDREKKVVYLSSIFKWFDDDFEIFAKRRELKATNKKNKVGALNFVYNYVGSRDQEFIAEEDYKIKYLPYDWSLNEQPGD